MATGDDAAEGRPRGRRDDYARIDARLQEIHARLVLHDGRFTSIELRLDAVLSEVLALAADRSQNRRRRWGRRR